MQLQFPHIYPGKISNHNINPRNHSQPLLYLIIFMKNEAPWIGYYTALYEIALYLQEINK